MESEIKTILRGLPGVKVKPVGSLWSISIGGSLAGARKDGAALAIDLRRQWEHIRDRERAAEVERVPARPELIRESVVHVTDPAMATRIAELEAMLSAVSAPQPEPAEGGHFDVDQLTDLLREDEPHADAQVRWLADYTSMTNQLVDDRLPPLTDPQRVYHGRLQRALYKGRAGAVEMI